MPDMRQCREFGLWYVLIFTGEGNVTNSIYNNIYLHVLKLLDIIALKLLFVSFGVIVVKFISHTLLLKRKYGEKTSMFWILFWVGGAASKRYLFECMIAVQTKGDKARGWNFKERLETISRPGAWLWGRQGL